MRKYEPINTCYLLTLFCVCICCLKYISNIARKSFAPSYAEDLLIHNHHNLRTLKHNNPKIVRQLLFLLFVIVIPQLLQAQNLEAQLNSPRVLEARSTKDLSLQREFEKRCIAYPPTEIYLRAFKKEGVLEVWAKANNGEFVKFKEYPICYTSGKLGPKRKQGDMQVPEGFYTISEYNPYSSYYLSLRVDYPNQSDRIYGGGYALGGDIYIHGDCVTEGCLPMTNDKIKEIYWLALLAHNNGQIDVPIHIFPYRFNNTKNDQLETAKHQRMPQLLAFWDNLRTGYYYFEQTHRLPNISVNGDGSYSFW